MNLGEKIKSYRIENNLTQSDIAKMVGTSRNLISDIERGRIKGTIDFISRLSNATNLPITYWTEGVSTETIKYKQYEALNVLVESLIDTGIIKDDGKLNDMAQKLIISVLEKEIAIKIKERKVSDK